MIQDNRYYASKTAAQARRSKVKGSRGEAEFAAILTAEGFPARRNSQRYVGGRGNPDVAATGLDRYHFEVKRVERLNINAAMEQAERDAAGRVPVVAHRRNRRPWLITMKLADWLKGWAEHGNG